MRWARLEGGTAICTRAHTARAHWPVRPHTPPIRQPHLVLCVSHNQVQETRLNELSPARTSSPATRDSAACATSSSTPGAGCAERRSAIGTGRRRAAISLATSAATIAPNEWPKKANGRPQSRVGRRALMTESHSWSRFAHAASAWRGPRPGYCTAQSEIVGGSS